MDGDKKLTGIIVGTILLPLLVVVVLILALGSALMFESLPEAVILGDQNVYRINKTGPAGVLLLRIRKAGIS